MAGWLKQQVASALDALRGRPSVTRAATAKLPTEFGDFNIHVYEIPATGETHVALVKGEMGDGENVLTRVHSSCVTGDIFHSARWWSAWNVRQRRCGTCPTPCCDRPTRGLNALCMRRGNVGA